MRIMKAILIGILLCTGVGIRAQDKIQVTSFNRMETDITARVTAPRKDQNGEVCALIRIVTTIKDLMFEPDALGIAARENKTGDGNSGERRFAASCCRHQYTASCHASRTCNGRHLYR